SLPGERAVCDRVVADPVPARVHMARHGERLQIEDGAAAYEAAIQVGGDRVAAASARDRTDDAVVIDVDHLVNQPVEPPADTVDDDVVRRGLPQDHAFDDVIGGRLAGEAGREGRPDESGTRNEATH